MRRKYSGSQGGGYRRSFRQDRAPYPMMHRGRGGMTYPQYLASRRNANVARIRRARSIGLKNIRTGGLLGVETKFLDVLRSAVAVTAPSNAAGGVIAPSGGCTGCLNAPGTGDGPSNREGMKIAMKSILVKGTVKLTNTVDNANPIPPVIFIALVLDTQTNGTTIDSSLVFTNPVGSSALNASLQRNMSYTERFKVLKIVILRPPDLSMMYDSTTSDAIGNGRWMPFVLKKNLGGLQVKFTSGSTTADVANVVDNSLHVIAFSTNAWALGTAEIYFNSRLRFVG